ncbi:MAG: prenyltransferase [Planctomycetaceae bacterium]|nr:prenyltransferase [Planctomycetaceae bacterium]
MGRLEAPMANEKRSPKPMRHPFRVLIFGIIRHCAVVALFLIAGVACADDVEKQAAKLITPATHKAVDQGLKWLAAGQRDDGSFGAGVYRGNVAVSALSGMAMMCGGSTPGRGPYGAQVNRCVDYLLASAQPSGFITGRDASHGPMYGHGFATMFLAECYGMSRRAELREKLSKAVKLIVECQNKQGGWRYQPVRADADISVTVCEMMALRAARNAGIFVPKETIDLAVDYVKRSQNADGGFMYVLQGGESAFPRSAAAVTALYTAGVYKGPEITKGLDYIAKFAPAEGRARREGYYFYGHYYAIQAMWQAGATRWQGWYPAIRDDLISSQRDGGSWDAEQEGSHCATAMACIILQIPNNYLPIFQR